ncbi:uncharacterized protein PHALS_04604 [Plasmopara halstedii]|uniref:Transmembrane protein n=1 Tax=Plasmopara halstedii TaxID=4781 RepID=A0A0P1A8Y5_PLAHL|nr:uncharacterized protein PHALS_04604 [Plasmopara halstedii]CEG37154.1 hypothetical protein PHALS_04604 [Plasmopara halstedii]|eukprot:XP_024573523.1 hypothetical protein PHALS_04604 [Plasmopara halstedii]
MDYGEGEARTGDSSGVSSTSTFHSKSFGAASRPVDTKNVDNLIRRLTPGESTMNDWVRTNAFADRNTIVDMSLRLPRFVLCVVVALFFAFGFALLTSNKKTLTYVYEYKLSINETLSAKASSIVEDYNTLFGYILFSGGKIFEVFCETLIFPTLATYLHNCSLYPGDQPARMYSVVKARCIFWGLKTVIILMNVGFTSVYVGQTTLEDGDPSRRLIVSDALSAWETMESVNIHADTFHTVLRTLMVGAATPFAYKEFCLWPYYDVDNSNVAQQWRIWASELDTTSVSFSFPSYTWNAALLSSQTNVPTMSAKIRLKDYLVKTEKYAISDDWDISELYTIYRQGFDKFDLISASYKNATAPQSLENLIYLIAAELKEALPSSLRVGDVALNLELRQLAGNLKFTSLTISIPVEANGMGSMMCGSVGCVYATSTSVLKQLHLQPAISIAHYEGDENSALLYGSGSQFIKEKRAASKPHEMLTLSLGKLAWQLDRDRACEDDVNRHCLGLSLSLGENNGILSIRKEALATQHVSHPIALVTLHPIVILDTTRFHDNEFASWYRLVSPDGLLVISNTFECNSLVDAYLTHLETNHFYLDEKLSLDMYSAALLYLVQHGVPTLSQRRLALSAVTADFGESPETTLTTDIEVNVPTATALVTVAGCLFIVLLMLCVIYLPTARVKLSPDTTPAAQYVQILTDDLYPDVVYKKRLRFVNGDCLLFNEYVVDAIVLHAKRDHTKKIYL